MENKKVIKLIRKYLHKHKSVDIKWYIKDKANGLGINKNDREVDVIVQGVLNSPWFTQYLGHNKNDISIKYSPMSKLSFCISLLGGAVGLIGGILGIVSFLYSS